MKSKKSISVVIPAYFAENTIETVIQSIPDWIDEIIVINDGSTDRTGEVVKSINCPKVFLVNLIKNMGVGNAVLIGYKVALERGADIIVKVDSDGQMDPNKIGELIEPILRNQANYTKGNRFFRRSGIRRMPLLRRNRQYWLIFLDQNGFWVLEYF